MRKYQEASLSIVVPVFNESGSNLFHQSLLSMLKKVDIDTYEVIYVDDAAR